MVYKLFYASALKQQNWI